MVYKIKTCYICKKKYIPNSGRQKTCRNQKCILKRKSLWENNRYKNIPKYQKRKRNNIHNYRIKKRRILRKWIIKYKKTLKCNRCKLSDYRFLVFHHKDKNIKNNTISGMITDCLSLQRIKDEINKCECLCCNCHAIEHYPK